MPTLAEISGAELPKNRILDGQDLSAIFKGGAGIERDKDIFFFRYFHDPVCMIRRDNWLLLGYVNEIPPNKRMYTSKTYMNIKRENGETISDIWKFQKKHMEFLKTAVPVNFELYDMNTDISQKKNVINVNPEIAKNLKQRMLQFREEMIKEGGDWYE